MSGSPPLHRHIEDAKVKYFALRRRYAVDGIDHREALKLIETVEADLFPLVDLAVERDEHIGSCIASPVGIRGQRPRRTWNAAQRRPLPANVIELYPETGDAA